MAGTDLAARVPREDREELERLAVENGRGISREAARAVRWYLSRFDDADRELRKQARERRQAV
jgi:hypothetical protein